ALTTVGSRNCWPEAIERAHWTLAGLAPAGAGRPMPTPAWETLTPNAPGTRLVIAASSDAEAARQALDTEQTITPGCPGGSAAAGAAPCAAGRDAPGGAGAADTAAGGGAGGGAAAAPGGGAGGAAGGGAPGAGTGTSAGAAAPGAAA